MRAVLDVLLVVIGIYSTVIVISVVFSYLIAFNVLKRNIPAVMAAEEGLRRVTEPVLAPIRRRLPNSTGLDLSPLVVFLVLIFIQKIITYYIWPNVP